MVAMSRGRRMMSIFIDCRYQHLVLFLDMSELGSFFHNLLVMLCLATIRSEINIFKYCV